VFVAFLLSQLVNAVMLLAVVTLWADTISMGIDVVDAG
jgi:hypothetical protein